MKELLELVPADVPIAVFLDYDGTLVAIRERPELARLHPKRKARLAGLGRKTLVGLVSGRPLDELRRMVGAAGIAYVGNHGMEIRKGGKTGVHPTAAGLAQRVARTTSAIRAKLGDLQGVLVEDKGLTASVHFRLASPRHRGTIRAIVAGEVRRSRGALILTEGKMVFEVRPNIPWDKGRGILKLMSLARCPKSCFPVYVGDDRTDEDAFRALADRGLTIHVGLARRTRARFRLGDVEQVWRFLAALEKRLGVSSGPRPGPGSSRRG
jgi:trehalose 6-phosphate phosphatase